MTRQPRRANSAAKANPIPRLAPVIKTVLPFIDPTCHGPAPLPMAGRQVSGEAQVRQHLSCTPPLLPSKARLQLTRALWTKHS